MDLTIDALSEFGGVVQERASSFLLIAASDCPAFVDMHRWRLDKGANKVNLDRCCRGLGVLALSVPQGATQSNLQRLFD